MKCCLCNLLLIKIFQRLFMAKTIFPCQGFWYSHQVCVEGKPLVAKMGSDNYMHNILLYIYVYLIRSSKSNLLSQGLFNYVCFLYLETEVVLYKLG